MDKYKTMENIANSFHAARKIRDLQSNLLREAPPEVKQSSIQLLNEILKTIGEHPPVSHKQNIQSVVDKSTQYTNTYRNLKNHLESLNSKKAGSHELARSLQIITPVLPNQHKIMVEKMLRILEVIYS
ncbi:MAG: hypothetical protein N2645_20550 [Clostridia bacterium]|nr:hypothetical protein [Clostridia bacterium]